jgi:hypothetical protein
VIEVLPFLIPQAYAQEIIVSKISTSLVLTFILFTRRAIGFLAPIFVSRIFSPISLNSSFVLD